MAKKWVSVEGDQELIRRLKAILRICRQEVGKINQEGAQRGADRARQLVPVRTGALLASIDVAGAGTTWRFGAYGYEGRSMVPFWVEYGTSRTPAHPYMTPAAEWSRTFIPTQTRGFARELPFLVRNA